ncbi:hypothetical protein [Methanococcoides sp. AM1]|uniref:hypothetical protein n=1 Tax=Methanococcoides sp. AM1 TaxID=1201011 RepID=UPI001083A4ED|nr:hypothetical protein [Methanococcoides sp. AM1]
MISIGLVTEFFVVIFGLLAAASWNASDFNEDFASKKFNIYGVAMIVPTVGLLFLGGSALLLQKQIPQIEEIIWGALAGIIISAGLIAFCRIFRRVHGLWKPTKK